MKFSEKELEDVLYKKLVTNEVETLYDKGFEYYDSECDTIYYVDRQVDLNPYGIADIIVSRMNIYEDVVEDRKIYETEIIYDIIELKAAPIKSKHIDQVLRYKEAIERFCEMVYNQRHIDDLCEIKVNPILIGENVQSGHFVLNNVIEDITIYTYDFNPIDGLQFEYQTDGWHKEEHDEYIDDIDEKLIYSELVDVVNNKRDEKFKNIDNNE